MALATGTRLGPYEIVSPLGAGGMGEVYKARDGRLDRMVAIKVLPAHLSGSPEFRQRLDREARIISQLAHPHVCALFDLGHQEGIDFFVMELLEGETLAARLARGPLPMAEVRRFGSQVADALEAAHRHGVIHRDLKPANIMLTRAGVKLLDFGIAKPVPDEGASTHLVPQLTAEGMVPGTVQYMAPEQIDGQAVTPRSDIFALGAVLYEMATGTPPFSGASRTALIAAILESEPTPMAALAPGSAGALEAIVTACLKKDPFDRWQSAHDVALQLRAIPDTGVSQASPGHGGRHRPGRPALAWLAAALTLGAVGGSWALATFRGGSPAGVGANAREVRASITLAADAEVVGGAMLAFTPDGTAVVYEGVRDGRRLLFRRRLVDTQSTPIDGTLSGTGPFISPDSQWVGFFDGKQLMKLPIEGGRPTPIAVFASVAGASWGDDGFIVVGTFQETGLLRVSADGGRPEPLTVPTAEDGGNDHRWPQVLPGGRGVLFSVGTGPEESARIVILDRRTGTRKDLLRGSSSARYVATGHLVYVREAELFAVPFDLERLQVSGTQARIASGVEEDTNGEPEYAFSADGDLVFIPGSSGGQQNSLALLNRSGEYQDTRFPLGPNSSPRFSPDGQRIALTVSGAKNNIWVYDILRGSATRVTSGRYHNPVWTPDGRLTFSKGPPDRLQLVRRAADESPADEVLTDVGPPQFGGDWTPDGRTLVYERLDPGSRWQLWQVTPGGGAPTGVVSLAYNARFPRLSPDGRWLAYVSDETGRNEVYVRALAGGRRWPISVEGGQRAVWSPDGRQILFRTLGTLGRPFQVVDVAVTADNLVVGQPRPWLKAETPGARVAVAFDVAPDGQHLAVIRLAEPPSRRQLNLALRALTPVSPDR